MIFLEINNYPKIGQSISFFPHQAKTKSSHNKHQMTSHLVEDCSKVSAFGHKRLFFTVFHLILLLSAVTCLEWQVKTNNANGGVKHPVLYEISTRPWLYELSAKYQHPGMKLKDVPDGEFLALKSKGVDMIWFMGVWELGSYGWARATDTSLRNDYGKSLPDYTFADIIGSPYAVHSYTCNPEIGTDDDLKSLKSKLNSMGLLVMLDFVPNHSAVDAPEVTQQSDYYVKVPNGTPKPYDPTSFTPNGVANGKDPYFSPWIDTAQFNYWNSKTRDFQLNNLLKVASLSDAIRCDMAMLLLNDIIQKTWGTNLQSYGWQRPSDEFWSGAISAVKNKYPSVQFMAEVYWGLEEELQSLGFDFTYDKTLYDKLGDRDVNSVRQYLSSLSFNYLNQSSHFIENHDEERAAEYFTPRVSMAAAIVTNTLPGIRFNYHGQWIGKKNRLIVQLRRSADESIDQNILNFYNTFIPLLKDEVFHSGSFEFLTASGADSWRLLVWKWKLQDEKRLVVINYTDGEGGGSVVLPDAHPIAGNDTIPVIDVLNGNTYYRSASEMQTEGLNVVVQSWWAQIFKY